MPDHDVSGWRQTLKRIPFIDRELRSLRRADEIEALQLQLQHHRQHRSRRSRRPHPPTGDSIWTGRIMDESAIPFLDWRPPGHYYSPVPTMNEIEAQQDRIFQRPDHLAGLDLNEDAQLALFKTLAPLISDVSFNVEPGARTAATSPTTPPMATATAPSSKPSYATCARPATSRWAPAGPPPSRLDTNDRYLDGRLRLTCIEPYPDDLNRLVRPGDDVEIIVSPVQDVDLARFEELEAGDILFIDCSHVVKTGSDAHHLITRVLPVVPSGVYIHIHDMFWPFEYPRSWIEEGRVWTEAYLLHAFLSFNPEFEIVLFNDWLTTKHHELMVAEVPALAHGPGARCGSAAAESQPELSRAAAAAESQPALRRRRR